MKKLIGFLVVVAALVLVSFYGIGFITEHTLKNNLVAINQSNGVFVDLKRYQRGWFSSKAQLGWRFHTPERLVKDQNGQMVTVPAQDYTIEMPLVIYHGPIILADSKLQFGLGYAHSDLAMPHNYEDSILRLFSKDSVIPKLSLSLFVNYLNQSRLELQLPELKLISKQGTDTLDVFGMNSHIRVSSDFEAINGAFVIDGANWIKNQEKVLLGKVVSLYELHKTEIGLYLGKASVTLPSLVLLENGQEKLALKQFEAQSSSSVDGGLFQSSFDLSVGRLTVHNEVYGPASLKIHVKNLDALALARINQQANQIQQNQTIAGQQALLMLLPEVPNLLSKGAQFELKEFQFTMPDGTVEGNLLLSLPKGDLGNPFQLLQKIVGHGQFKIPSVVLKEFMTVSIKQSLSRPSLQQAMIQQMRHSDKADQGKTDGNTVSKPEETQAQKKPMTESEIEQEATQQTEQKLEALVKSGLLVLHDKDYVIDMKLEQGQLSINDQPFNPATMHF